MKLYTKTGDDGSTGLFGGDRVPKDHPRVETYGTIDELNASLGCAEVANDPQHELGKQFAVIFRTLQSRLFDLGADLATPEANKHEAKIARIEQGQIDELEQWIDSIEAGNDPMTNFILPGGTELASRLHLARTIGRRAERNLVSLTRVAKINPLSVIYLNRLSDLLFAMARRANKEAGIEDVPWIPGSSDSKSESK
ncbi:MAG: cob(I)yrinic acid a,c-diamide adenosyltransferase [Planctomycetota bacterium]|nr:cob(I)yrinic acid a,c-diamide adenosyltransferase [Planctomycetota bacterium]